MQTVLLCILLVAATAYAGNWEELYPASPRATIKLRFALHQQNLDVLKETLLDVSSPYSANYGKWWTPSAILDLVAPPMSVSSSIVAFLKQKGATSVENRRDMIKCEMRVKDAEELLQTTLFEYQHTYGKTIIRTRTGYTVPSEISSHVAFVAGLEEFPQVKEVKTHPIVEGQDLPGAGYIIPSHIQEMYKIPTSWPNNKASSIGLIEFEDDQSYDPSDLVMFNTEMAVAVNVSHIVGGLNYTEPDAESTLDVEYGGAIAINASVWFWTVEGWMYEFATDLQNATSAPLVVSMSWGWPEPLQCQIDPNGCGSDGSFAYVDRVNIEFEKIGLSGITLVAASGDQGAPGDGNADCTNTTSPLSTIFPGASPWVLSVGATMLETLLDSKTSAASPPVCSKYKCATSTKEEVCTYPKALITTGGGFSNLSPREEYQNAAVNAYFAENPTLPSANFFNKSNRGFPDVSALGHNYLLVIGGSYEPVDGTSCSSPVMAGIIALLNSERLNNKKSSLGFVVPAIYAAYAADASTFTDITKGNNKCTEYCCAKYGYEAAKGWDPVTGLGTPQFPQLLKYVQSLP